MTIALSGFRIGQGLGGSYSAGQAARANITNIDSLTKFRDESLKLQQESEASLSKYRSDTLAIQQKRADLEEKRFKLGADFLGDDPGQAGGVGFVGPPSPLGPIGQRRWDRMNRQGFEVNTRAAAVQSKYKQIVDSGQGDAADAFLEQLGIVDDRQLSALSPTNLDMIGKELDGLLEDSMMIFAPEGPAPRTLQDALGIAPVAPTSLTPDVVAGRQRQALIQTLTRETGALGMRGVDVFQALERFGPARSRRPALIGLATGRIEDLSNDDLSTLLLDLQTFRRSRR